MSNKFNDEILKSFDEKFNHLEDDPETRGIGDDIKTFLLTSLQRVREDERKYCDRTIEMLRQWLNEDRNCEPMVTNEDIKYWLELKDK